MAFSLDYRSHRVGNKAECPKEQTYQLDSQLSNNPRHADSPQRHETVMIETTKRTTQVTWSQRMLEETRSMGCRTRRILPVGAAAADPHSRSWRWRCCCCCVPARLEVELSKSRLGDKQKLALPINGRNYKHRSGIYMKIKICLQYMLQHNVRRSARTYTVRVSTLQGSSSSSKQTKQYYSGCYKVPGTW